MRQKSLLSNIAHGTGQAPRMPFYISLLTILVISVLWSMRLIFSSARLEEDPKVMNQDPKALFQPSQYVLKSSSLGPTSSLASDTKKTEATLDDILIIEYCNTYRDLREAFCGGDFCAISDSNHLSKCKHHRVTFGIAEGRDVKISSFAEHCCNIPNTANIGHQLTDSLHRAMDCGQVISTAGKVGYDTIISQFNSTAMMALRKVVKTAEECNAYYMNNTKKLIRPRSMAFSMFYSTHFGDSKYQAYDPVRIRNDLRYLQHRLLSSCGINSVPVFDDQGFVDETRRPPSNRVLLIRRSKSRVLRGIDQIVQACRSLGLQCDVFEAGSLSSSTASDVCAILRDFSDALIIGAQGAELVYTYYLGSRHLLVTPNQDNYQHPRQRAAKTWVQGWQEVFYSEFAFHLGAPVTFLEGNIVEESLTAYNDYAQCAENPVFCADLTLDPGKVVEYLRQKLDHGELKDSQGRVNVAQQIDKLQIKEETTNILKKSWQPWTSSRYVPAFVEESILKDMTNWGWDIIDNRPGCTMWTDPMHPLYSYLHLFLRELGVYQKRISEFPHVREDIRLLLFPNGARRPWRSGGICRKLRLHPRGLDALFPSGQLSRVNSEYVEPLTTPMRHPMFCVKPGSSLYDIGYMVHDFEATCRKLQPNSRTVLIDMGSSLPFQNSDPILNLLELYQRFGFKFDHIYGFERDSTQPSSVFGVGNISIPVEYIPAYHWVNVGVTDEERHVLNPLHTILRNFNEEDFVVIKLDIDTPKIENGLILQLLEDDSLNKLVDHMYFEHRVHMAEMAVLWGPSMQGTLQDTFELFFALRSKGIAAHFWV